MCPRVSAEAETSRGKLNLLIYKIEGQHQDKKKVRKQSYTQDQPSLMQDMENPQHLYRGPGQAAREVDGRSVG